MQEHYKSRFNISGFFTNYFNDFYNNYLIIIMPLLYIIPILLFVFLFILSYKIMNVTIIICVFLYIGLLIVSYRLIKSLKIIQIHPLITNYINFYKTANLIFKENFFNSDYVNILFKEQLLSSINNASNLYGDDALFLLNTSYDLLLFLEINPDTNNYITKLYIDDFKQFKFLNKSMQFISQTSEGFIIDLKLLSEKFPIEHQQLLKYFNDKYYTKLKSLYQPLAFTANYQNRFDRIIKNFKNIIFNYLWILFIFIIILLQVILLNLNSTMTYIYSGVIISLILLMYIYNNI